MPEKGEDAQATERIIVEPRGQTGCVYLMNLPLIKNGRVIADPWPVPAWVSFN